MAGAGDDASPRPNFDKSPGENVSVLQQMSKVRSSNQIKVGKAKMTCKRSLIFYNTHEYGSPE